MNQVLEKYVNFLQASSSTSRTYPSPLAGSNRVPKKRHLSFVVVQISPWFEWNIAASPDVYADGNELIIVENPQYVRFSSMATAVNVGIEQATREIIVVVEESVFLIPTWQQQLELSLDTIDRSNPDWGVLGPVGINADSEQVGHSSNPEKYFNTLQVGHREVRLIDDHLLIFRRDTELRADEGVHGLYYIGWDLATQARAKGMKCFAIDAPTIQEFMDITGKPVVEPQQAYQVVRQDNHYETYVAEREFANEYLSHRNPEAVNYTSSTTGITQHENPDALLKQFELDFKLWVEAPIILIGKGGGGTRLLSEMAFECGVFRGNKINESGDCIDLVIPIYKALLAKYMSRTSNLDKRILSEILLAAANMLRDSKLPIGSLWGFKLPESMMLMDELLEVFPRARVIHLLRHPLSACLRGMHITAKMDNGIGRVTLPTAYKFAGIPVEQIIEDSKEVHSAYAYLHQVKVALKTCRKRLPANRYLEIKFEHIISRPKATVTELADWLNLSVPSITIHSSISPKRAGHNYTLHSSFNDVFLILRNMIFELNYHPEDPIPSYYYSRDQSVVKERKIKTRELHHKLQQLLNKYLLWRFKSR